MAKKYYRLNEDSGPYKAGQVVATENVETDLWLRIASREQVDGPAQVKRVATPAPAPVKPATVSASAPVETAKLATEPEKK